MEWDYKKYAPDRHTAYLRYLVDGEFTNPQLCFQRETGFQGVYMELAKLELNRRGLETPAINRTNYKNSIHRVTERLDCADFVIPAFLTILNRYSDSPLLPQDIRLELEKTVLDYKYWIDEPVVEINHTCYFTENHQILFHTIEYLAGQMYPDRIFTNNGETGAWHREHGLTYLKRWLTWRTRFGFGEWLSNGYYSEDLVGLAVLVEFAQDKEIQTQAAMIIDLLLFDMALHSFKGVFGSTSGRMYNSGTMNPSYSDTSSVAALMWGVGSVDGGISLSSVLLAAFQYQCAPAIQRVALDPRDETEILQRMSFNVEDSYKYGIDPKDFDNIMLYWSMHTFYHRQVIENSRKFTPEWYDKDTSIAAYLEHFKLMEAANRATDQDPNSSALTQVDIYTYKTPNYMLSCAQDYRKGRGNFQQHIWQASLGGRALVFTTHPGSNDYTGRPNYFVGNGIMPKTNAYRNVLISIHRIPADCTFGYCTHAYFPVHEFDAFTQQNGWLFGRKDNGYIALRSLKAGGIWRDKDPALFKSLYHYTWEEEFARAANYEYWVHGHANAWICEMGEEKTHGSFQEFVAAVSTAVVEGDTFGLRYESPSLGVVEAGWMKPFTVAGKEIFVKDYPRYDTPYCKAEFDTKAYEIACGDEKLELDFAQMERRIRK